MIKRGYEYIDGSTVKKLEEVEILEKVEYDVYEENEVLREKKRYKINRKIKMKLVLATIAVLAAGLCAMYRFAAITKISYEINQKEKEYAELRNQNALLKVQIETQTDLSDIKEAAETRLGMQMPDKSQIVYIKVPRNDYTVVMDTQKKSEDDGNVIKAFINRASGLIGLFE